MNRNGFGLYDVKGHLVARMAMKNNIYPMTLKTVYCNYGLLTFKGGTDQVMDQQPDEHLEARCSSSRNPLFAFDSGGIPTLDTCSSCALTKAKYFHYKTVRRCLSSSFMAA